MMTGHENDIDCFIDTNIFIHPEYLKRLSQDIQDLWSNIIDNDMDYFPIWNTRIM
jgi:hypothetical protein